MMMLMMDVCGNGGRSKHGVECARCAQVVHVGDSMDHDVKGATGAAIDSLFIAAGIHVKAPRTPSTTNPQHPDTTAQILASA
eukprot:1464884-Rhodomonas_salina.1